MEVRLGQSLLLTLPPNERERWFAKAAFEGDAPQEGDVIEIVQDGTVFMSAPLIRD